jgi:hypothetical protein
MKQPGLFDAPAAEAPTEAPPVVADWLRRYRAYQEECSKRGQVCLNVNDWYRSEEEKPVEPKPIDPCWHRPGVLVNGVRACRTCGIGITECACSNFGRTPKPKCEECRGSAWVPAGGVEGAR